MATPAPVNDAGWKVRQARFREFDRGVFNIMKLALAYDMNQATFDQVAKDIRLSITPEVRAEMLIYTRQIKIIVTGRQWRYGWWWNRKTYKHMTADIVFEPYKSSLSVWTDPKEPAGIVCFQ